MTNTEFERWNFSWFHSDWLVSRALVVKRPPNCQLSGGVPKWGTQDDLNAGLPLSVPSVALFLPGTSEIAKVYAAPQKIRFSGNWLDHLAEGTGVP